MLQTKYIDLFSKIFLSWIDNLGETGRTRKQVVGMIADSFLAVTALWLAYSMRLGIPFSDFYHTWYLFLSIPFVVPFLCSCIGVYRWVIRSTNFLLFRQLLKASVLSSLALLIIVSLLPPDRANPRSLFFIFGMLLFLGMIGVRSLWQSLFGSGNKGAPVAIYGAGSAGRQLADSLSLGTEFRPVMFFDDSPTLKSTTVAGLPVISGEDLRAASGVLKTFEVGRIIIAMPSLTNKQYSERLAHIRQLNVPVQSIPTIANLLTGKQSVDQIRDVSTKDILGRNEVSANAEAVAKCVLNKTVLVTGGGGSIGSELCRQVFELGASKLVILDHSEVNLYQITEELTVASNKKIASGQVTADFLPVLCSIKDSKRITELLDEHHIDTIYHAAAYKRVPIIERQPQQGTETNVFGTQIVLDAAVKAGVANFTLISTDKAVRPANAMGASKRVVELILKAKATESHNTNISMVRFGNVLGSSGSVVPKFKEQILHGGPITITHPEITRYFMTIPEAAQLVLQSSTIATGGDVFVLNMGEPVKILDLAKSMVALAGARLSSETKNPEDIEIVFDGLRPGEKMYEELFITENLPTSIEKVFTANESSLPPKFLEGELKKLKALVSANNNDHVRELLIKLAFVGSEDSGESREKRPEKIRKLESVA